MNFPAQHLRAVLFDMDGVLFDSMPGHAHSWHKIVQDFHLEISEEEAYMHEGRTGASTITLLAERSWHRKPTAEEIERIYAAKCKEFNSLPPAPRMPGAEALLQQVQAAGKKILVVTGSGQASLLERLGSNYPGFFQPEFIVSSKDVRHGKPSPEPYLIGLEKAGVRADEAVVVENAPLGIQSAVAAGIFTIAVNTGPLPPVMLKEAGAHLVFPSMQALADGWQALFRAEQL